MNYIIQFISNLQYIIPFLIAFLDYYENESLPTAK